MAIHDATYSQVWSAPSKKTECTLCNELFPSVCDCGAQRFNACKGKKHSCNNAFPEPHYQGNPYKPQEFYVRPSQMSEKEKLLFIALELGKGAELSDFATKLLVLFGDISQNAALLRLFAQYQPELAQGWKKESDLTPDCFERVQQIWSPNAPQRCRVCSKT